MLLLIGLGNPGEKYRNNRHNVGHQIVDAIADEYGFSPAREKFNGLLREGVIESGSARSKALTLKPTTYYNESGRAVQALLQFYKLSPSNIVVFHDELDLAPGKVKIKSGGGAAGNNGIKSISANIGPDFARVRIGIGHPGDKNKVTSYVLNDFSRADRDDWLDELMHAIVLDAPLLSIPETGHAKFLSSVAHRTGDQRRSTGQAQKKSTRKENASSQEKKTPTQREIADQSPSSPFDVLKGILKRD